jgi:hypothetical protein
VPAGTNAQKQKRHYAAAVGDVQFEAREHLRMATLASVLAWGEMLRLAGAQMLVEEKLLGEEPVLELMSRFD